MISDAAAKKAFSDELRRQNAPSKHCPKCKTSVVKIGTMCPVCGVKVEA